MENYNSDKTLGDTIREARVNKGLSLRGLAKDIEKTPSYLSDIENNRRVPSEEVLVDISKTLDLEFDLLMALAGRFGENAMRYLKRTPSAGVLFRKISQLNLSSKEIQELINRSDELKKLK